MAFCLQQVRHVNVLSMDSLLLVLVAEAVLFGALFTRIACRRSEAAAARNAAQEGQRWGR